MTIPSLSKVKVYVELFPAIINTIITLEQVIPLPGQGKAKLELILAMIQQLSSEIKDINFEELKGTITNIVSTIVSALKLLEVFKGSK